MTDENASVYTFELVTLFRLKFDCIFSVWKKRDKYIFQKLITLRAVMGQLSWEGACCTSMTP